MARGQRNTENETTQTIDTDAPAPETSDNVSTVAVGTASDRGNIGTVTIEPDTEDWGSVRTRRSDNPVALAVRNAVKGESYGITVENDDKKIERVKRMLRSAAADKLDPKGMHIHPVLTPVGEPDENGRTALVKVRFKTGDRNHKTVTATPDTTVSPDDAAAHNAGVELPE